MQITSPDAPVAGHRAVRDADRFVAALDDLEQGFARRRAPEVNFVAEHKSLAETRDPSRPSDDAGADPMGRFLRDERRLDRQESQALRLSARRFGAVGIAN